MQTYGGKPVRKIKPVDIKKNPFESDIYVQEGIDEMCIEAVIKSTGLKANHVRNIFNFQWDETKKHLDDRIPVKLPRIANFVYNCRSLKINLHKERVRENYLSSLHIGDRTQDKASIAARVDVARVEILKMETYGANILKQSETLEQTKVRQNTQKMKIDFKKIVEGITNSIFVKEEVEKIAQYRESRCNRCEHMSKNVERLTSTKMGRKDKFCTDCGCNIHLATRSMAKGCPLGSETSKFPNEKPKWLPVTDSIEEALAVENTEEVKAHLDDYKIKLATGKINE